MGCVSNSASIRGARVGAGPMGEQDRGFKAERITVSYYCSAGHEYSPQYAANVDPAEIPELIDCPNCGLPAGQPLVAHSCQEFLVPDVPLLVPVFFAGTRSYFEYAPKAKISSFL